MRRIEHFQRFARAWMDLVNRAGGGRHGYFLSAEGASDVASALFSFPSLAEYKRYRAASAWIPGSWRPTASATRVDCVIRMNGCTGLRRSEVGLVRAANPISSRTVGPLYA